MYALSSDSLKQTWMGRRLGFVLVLSYGFNKCILYLNHNHEFWSKLPRVKPCMAGWWASRLLGRPPPHRCLYINV